MTFEEWITDEMDRGLSQLEVDQMRAAWDAATKAEREACAKACDEEARKFERGDGLEDHACGAEWCADKIRMRSNVEAQRTGKAQL